MKKTLLSFYKYGNRVNYIKYVKLLLKERTDFIINFFIHM
jgi:hypothetical protein